MADRLPWFNCYPSKLLGALAEMKPDQKLVYVIILLRIYEVWGPCRDSLDALTIRCGINRRRITEALDALFKAGKLEREGAGIINPFSRSVMASTFALREERVRAGKKGAKKRWKKTEENQSGGDGEAKPKPLAKNGDLHLEQQEQDLFPTGNKTPRDWPDDYRERFWAIYPRRTEKKSALAKLEAIRKSAKVPWQRFWAGVVRCAEESRGKEERFIKHPTTWLNRGCWDDEVARAMPAGPSKSSQGFAAVSLNLMNRGD